MDKGDTSKFIATGFGRAVKLVMLRAISRKSQNIAIRRELISWSIAVLWKLMQAKLY